jgi:hypothetical protein
LGQFALHPIQLDQDRGIWRFLTTIANLALQPFHPQLQAAHEQTAIEVKTAIHIFGLSALSGQMRLGVARRFTARFAGGQVRLVNEVGLFVGFVRRLLLPFALIHLRFGTTFVDDLRAMA